MKSLVVEGDLMSQCVLAKLLGERGHAVQCFENAEQAVLAYQKEFYPLVIVGVDLPGMDGLQFCRWLRSQANGGRTYIMVAAAPGQPGDLSQILGAGASDFLMKPYEVGMLKARLGVAEQHMNAFFRDVEQAEERRRREQETEGMQTELHRAAELLAREAEARLKAEETLQAVQAELAQARDAFDQQVKDQAKELVATADQLQSVTSFRLKVEDDLKRVRTELQSQAGRHAEELASLRKELAAEKEKQRTLHEEGQKSREKLQARITELTQAGRQADLRRQELETEAKRLAEVHHRAQAEWDVRQRELTEQVARVRRQAEEEGAKKLAQEAAGLKASGQRLEKELAETREDFAKRLQEHTAELIKIDGHLQTALAARRHLDEELAKARQSAGPATSPPPVDEGVIRRCVAEAVKQALQEAKPAAEAEAAERAQLQESLEGERVRRARAEEQLERLRADMLAQLQRVSGPAGTPQAKPVVPGS